MFALACASWLLLPIAPINPIVHDTLPRMTLHSSIGVWGPSNLLSAGPEIALRGEFLLAHPLAFRSGIELRQATSEDISSPRGDVRSATFIGELMVYRGTRKLMGFLGFGAGYTLYDFDPDQRTRDSLSSTLGVSDVSLENALLLRVLLGLRFRGRYAVEIKFSDTRGRFTTIRPESGETVYVTDSDGSAAGAVSLTVGYLFDL